MEKPSASSSPPAREPKVLLGKYELGRLIGRGGSGAKVYAARDIHTGTQVAVKAFRNPRAGAAGAAAIEKEIAMLGRLRHRHVVRLHEVLATKAHVFLVMELARGGELFARVESLGRLPEDLARRYFRQLISALRYCHLNGVYHRDIKPDNLLLGADGELMLSDFGLGAMSDPTDQGPSPLSRTVCGTPAYVAPEILARKPYDAAGADVWSSGVVLFAMAAGYLPFNHINLAQMYRKIYRGEFRCPKWFSGDLRDLIHRILNPDPGSRIDVDGIVRHPWFTKDVDHSLEWKAMAMDHRISKQFKDEEDGSVNAFDIIGCSLGPGLSGLVAGGGSPCRERLLVAGSPEWVLSRVEWVGEREELKVGKSEGKKRSAHISIEEADGDVLVRLVVRRASEQLSLVEAATAAGAAADRLWNQRLKPALRS